jgi:hypothetical protein
MSAPAVVCGSPHSAENRVLVTPRDQQFKSRAHLAMQVLMKNDRHVTATVFLKSAMHQIASRFVTPVCSTTVGVAPCASRDEPNCLGLKRRKAEPHGHV